MKSNRLFIAIVLISGIIAGALLATVFRSSPLLASDSAKAKFSDMEISATIRNDGFILFDKSNGNIWFYDKGDYDRGYESKKIGTLTAPGAPLKP